MIYGSSVSDYFLYEFFDKKRTLRREFVTYKEKNDVYHYLNQGTHYLVFDNKPNFLKEFSEYIGRDWIVPKEVVFEEFEKFCERHPIFMCKPQGESCGTGVHKVTLTLDSCNLRELYDEYCVNNVLLEEVIDQHHIMASLYSECLNTIRISTIVDKNEKMNIIGACLRCGNGSKDVDNYCAGGIASKIDPETGIVVSLGANQFVQRFEKHPITGIVLPGFQIPYWNEILEIISHVALRYGDMRYMGWDVAITENGPVLVEGNPQGMFNVLQQPANKGIRKELEKIMANT